MSLPDPLLLELNELCQALEDGTISAEQQARLSELLLSDEEARRHYVRAAGLAASLCSYAAEMQSDAPAPLTEREAPSQASWWSRPAWWAAGSLAAAVVFVLALWLGRGGFTDSSAPLASQLDPEESVARITGLKDCRWTGASFQPGDEIRPGEQLQIASGFVAITFDSGAQVTLEGPASLDVRSAWNALLRHGSLSARISPESAGFRIANRSVEVVDLGTEFSMIADDSGSADVFVVKGAVQAVAPESSAAKAAPLLLREKESRRFGKAGVSAVSDHDKKLARLLRRVAWDRIVTPPNYAQWSFDEGDGGRFEPRNFGLNASAFVVPLPAGSSAEALQVSGRWGKALHLDGNAAAQAVLNGWTESSPRTVAFWVRLPADSLVTESAAIFTWAPRIDARGALRVLSSSDPSIGVLGALRTDLGRGCRIGVTPLHDGQWHHIALAIAPQGRGLGKLQLKQYVDGRLESCSAKRSFKLHGRGAEDLAANLFMGGESFRGDIDELFIADRILAPQEIKQLMQHNTLGAAAPLVAAE